MNACIAPLFWLAATFFDGGTKVADIYQPGDDALFLFEASGKRVGYHWFTYAGEEPVDGKAGGKKACRFTGGLQLDQPTPIGMTVLRSSGELFTDDAGHPLRFSLKSEASGVRSTIDLTFADGKTHAELTQGPSKRALDIACPPAAFLLANNWIGMVELIAAVAPPSAGAPSKLQLYAGDAGQVIPFELKHAGTFKEESGKAGDTPLEGEKYLDSLGETLLVEKSGKLARIEIAAAGLTIRRVDPEKEKVERFVFDFAPVLPGDFKQEEVEIVHRGLDGKSGEVRLSGTLSRRKEKTGRLPALFFISGSGGQDREGLSGGVDLGTHELLDRLVEEGFAVLRVDDRGVGRSTGPTTNLSYDDLIADARACADFLLARPDVDAKHVFAIGHSEGGETAPIVACERPLAGAVLMAAPGRSLKQILHDQKLAELQKAMAAGVAGLTQAQLDAEMAEHAKFLELICGEGEIDPTQIRADYRPYLAQRAWFQGHAKHDALAQIAQVKCPLLILQGAMDLQVSAELDAPPLEKAAKAGGNADVTLRLFPKLDHLFKKIEGDKSDYADYLKRRPVAREFLDCVAAWLKERAAR